MIVDNDHTYIKITESKENKKVESTEDKKTEPVIPKIVGKKALVERGQGTIEPVNVVVVDLPLTEKQRAEVELFKQLINS